MSMINYNYNCVIIGNKNVHKTYLGKTSVQNIKFINNNTDMNSKKLFLHIGYQNRNDIKIKINKIKKKIMKDDLKICDIKRILLNYITKSPCTSLDLITRTSGTERLSDFMQMHLDHTILLFESPASPEYSTWEIYKSFMRYQIFAKYYHDKI